MKRSLFILALSLVAMTTPVRAEIVSMPDYSDADIEYVDRTELRKLGDAAAFVAKYLVALRERTLLAHMPLLHPSSQACMADENTDFFTALLNQDLRMKKPMGDDYKVGLLAITKAEGAARDTRPPLRLSIAPTHLLVVSYGSPTDGTYLIRFLVKDAEQYVAVLPCPDAEMLRRFRVYSANK